MVKKTWGRWGSGRGCGWYSWERFGVAGAMGFGKVYGKCSIKLPYFLLTNLFLFCRSCVLFCSDLGSEPYGSDSIGSGP